MRNLAVHKWVLHNMSLEEAKDIVGKGDPDYVMGVVHKRLPTGDDPFYMAVREIATERVSRKTKALYTMVSRLAGIEERASLGGLLVGFAILHAARDLLQAAKKLAHKDLAAMDPDEAKV